MKYIGFVVVLIAVIGIIIIAKKGQKKTDSAILQFATSKGYSFNPKPKKSSLFDINIFAKSNSLTLRDQVTISDARSIVTCFAAERSGSSSEYLVSISKIASQNNNFNLYPIALSGMFILDNRGLTRYELEGQLAQLYELYIQQGTETEALTVLQPDILLDLATNFRQVSVVARPGTMYLLMRSAFTTSATANQDSSYESVFNKLNNVSDKLLRIAEPPTAISQPQLSDEQIIVG